MDINEMIKLYNEGASLAALGRIVERSSSTVKKQLVAAGVRIRTQREQNVFTNKARKKALKEDYFSKITSPNQAWLMGFLASDGTISTNNNTIKIGLSSCDREILEKIQSELEYSQGKIYDHQTQQGFLISELRWTSAQQKQDLARFGIVPNKTYKKMELPEIEEKLKLAFILGYFDGDGSFSINKDARYCRLRFCAYRKEILQSIADYLEKHYEAHYSLSSSHQRQMFELSVSTKFAISILKDAYTLCPLCLQRKKIKFLEYINHETTTSDIDEKIC